MGWQDPPRRFAGPGKHPDGALAMQALADEVDDGTVYLAQSDPASLAQRHGVTGMTRPWTASPRPCPGSPLRRLNNPGAPGETLRTRVP